MTPEATPRRAGGRRRSPGRRADAPAAVVHPGWAVPGGRIDLEAPGLPLPADGPPTVTVGGVPARVSYASSHRLRFVVPPDAPAGTVEVRVEGAPHVAALLQVGRVVVSGVHLVDSPLFDRDGRLYLTHSGSREARAPVALERVARDGTRDALPATIANPTSLARGADGAVYVSSRFDGHVYRLAADGSAELYASELGVATGLAMRADGTLFVGDRSGQIMRVSAARHVDSFATLPASVAAFHLALGPDDCLYVSAPTLATHDVVYRITPDRLVDVYCDGLGRPQGLAFDATGTLYVVDALAGAAGLYRVNAASTPARPELVLSAPALVGVAFDPAGGLIVCSNDTVWRLASDLTPLG